MDARTYTNESKNDFDIIYTYKNADFFLHISWMTEKKEKWKIKINEK